MWIKSLVLAAPPFLAKYKPTRWWPSVIINCKWWTNVWPSWFFYTFILCYNLNRFILISTLKAWIKSNWISFSWTVLCVWRRTEVWELEYTRNLHIHTNIWVSFHATHWNTNCPSPELCSIWLKIFPVKQGHQGSAADTLGLCQESRGIG